MGNEIWPTWSPDSAQLAFAKPPHAYLKTLTGAQSTLLENEQRQKYPSDWSRDGKFVVYRTIGASATGDLWALPLQGDRKPFPVIESSFEETRAQFSPDGQWISYESNQSGRNEVYVRRFNAPSVPIQISVSGGSEARWHPNGRELFYIGPGPTMMSVGIRRSPDGTALEPSAPRQLFAAPVPGSGRQAANVKFQYAVSADGTRFLINEVLEGNSASPLIVVLNWKPQ
ncbi:MAG: TolB family protein [Vicinamibacterales bacterium]